MEHIKEITSFSSYNRNHKEVDLNNKWKEVLTSIKTPLYKTDVRSKLSVISSKGETKIYLYEPYGKGKEGKIIGISEGKKEMEVIFSVEYYFEKFGSNRVPGIMRADVAKKHRGYGVQLLGYKYLLEKYGSLISDEILSIGSISSTWKRIAQLKKYKVVLFNKKTKEIIDPEEFDIDVFSMGSDGIDYEGDEYKKDPQDPALAQRKIFNNPHVVLAAFKKGKI